MKSQHDPDTANLIHEIEPATEFEAGQHVGAVDFDIDYAIIKHFSEHLYSSPNKAIEELVSNSFDALATKCYVYVPGEHVPDRVIVWDDGVAMDTLGIKEMWMIARSPKERLGPGRVIEAEGRRRAAIGKFGIGKLASYAVGDRISHLSKRGDGEFFSVSVNYRDFTDRPAGEEDDPVKRKLTAPIKSLTEEQARQVVDDVLPSGEATTALFNEPHWTIAVIDDLKDVKLYPGRLSWVLGNGMPLRPDFRVFVEDSPVESRIATDAENSWNLADLTQSKALSDAWSAALDDGKVAGDLISSSNVETEPKADHEPVEEPYVVFPSLGRVTATIRVFERSLSAISEEQGRSFGFFVLVRGRLVNPDDDKLLLNDPSFGTFYRSQFIIHADGLDEELLADRESLRRDTPMTRELLVLQQALYRRARQVVEASDSTREKKAKPESRLPARSRELFRDPMTALLVRRQGEARSEDLDEPQISRSEVGEDRAISDLDPETGKFVVNRSHPFYREFEAQAGGGRRGQSMLAAFDLIAVSERLTEGFLFSRGFDDDQILDVMTWRDALLRALAEGYSRNPEDVILEVTAASVPGGERFEVAVTSLLNMMGFIAVRNGASGCEDITVTAPVGPSHQVFTVEPKGSAAAVGNVTAAIASAAAHRDAVPGAVHAVVVAREFAGFQDKNEPAVLKECTSTKGVSVVHVDTLIQMYRALQKYAYPLETLMDTLFVVETPKSKAERVEGLGRPLNAFNFRDLLNEIWRRQQGESSSDVVPIRTLWQSQPKWKESMTFPEFTAKLAALDYLTGPLLTYDPTERTVYINQAPEYVAQHVEEQLAEGPRAE